MYKHYIISCYLCKYQNYIPIQIFFFLKLMMTEEAVPLTPLSNHDNEGEGSN
jgi:hypothetical protein